MVVKMSAHIPMFACSSMDHGGTDIAKILLLLAGWGLSGLLALVNLFLIVFLKLPLRFKKVNFAGWACYVVPGIILVLGLYGWLPLEITSSPIWMVYIVAMPFVTTAHLIYLVRTRRRSGVRSRRFAC